MASGLACQLAAQVCSHGSVLNYSKTKCIPGSPTYVPFPLLILAAVGALVCYISSRRHKGSLFLTNTIAFWGLLETVGIFWLLVQADEMGVLPSIALTAIALMFLLGCNLFFIFMFCKQVLPDQTFKYWVSNYNKTTAVVLALTFVNFKSSRIFYGNFGGLDMFNAPFNDPDQFYKPFSFMSIFNVITVVLPVLIADVVAYVHIDWGYQLFILSIETGCLTLGIIAMTFCEYKYV
jgi:hypothetical protein